MNVTCAISGLRLKVPGLENIGLAANAGYFHPIFLLPQKELYKLYYTKHINNKLSSLDSYLLFLAFLHNTEHVEWQAPSTCKPTDKDTIKLVQNNLAQLISVSEKTSVIRHPSFKQPKFIVSYDNGKLRQVHNWITAWDDNLKRFNATRANRMQRQDLLKVESQLQERLSAGATIEELPAITANWASQAAKFPPNKEEQYTRVIRSCFNTSKMFNTPLTLIREVQEYCFANIEPGSIHFHTLCETLKEGASRHLDYLGGSSLALGYTLLDTAERSSAAKAGDIKTQAQLITISQKATAEPPNREDFSNKLDFLKARLAYKVAITLAANNTTTNTTKKDTNL